MSWLHQLKRSVFQHKLRQRKIPAALWFRVEKRMPLLSRYTREERVKLRIIASEVLAKKRMTPVQGLDFTLEMAVTIATQIAVAIYGLATSDDLENEVAFNWLSNWHEIFIYPTAYRTHRPPVIPLEGGLLGIEVDVDVVEAGETYAQGPIIINWDNDAPHPLRKQANQVMIHELSHKLDMLNGGTANGFPPLHKNMSSRAWFEAFEMAFEQLNHQLEKGQRPAMNPYAATNAAEFFAVSTEYFFEAPQVLNKVYPNVYHQMRLFYRQNPLGG